MPGPTEPDLDVITGLAGLELSPRQRRELRPQIARILEHVSRLDELDLDDVPPTRHGLPLAPVERHGRRGESLDRDVVLDAAPASDEGYFVVPPALPDE